MSGIARVRASAACVTTAGDNLEDSDLPSSSESWYTPRNRKDKLQR